MDKLLTLEETKVLAEQGDMEAQFNMGFTHYNGIEKGDGKEYTVITRGYEKAFEWFTKAAEQGHADAQNNLGLMYKAGLGVSHDDYVAFEWFTKAAEQGHADAQNNLGLLYRDGKGAPQIVHIVLHGHEINETTLSPQDYEELFREFGLDTPESFDYSDVAKVLFELHGIDHDMAVDWFTKAAASGSEAAKINLKNMSNS
uniref:tetratricopeptide repeat protein n=1 Tax=Psychrobacter sp. TaxID=56811 RepID=UPI00159AB3EC|nr:tetratricopeptide repeat protein [Psychrobacter sp.]QJS05259.1 sel1 repeat protein [Psychrobacter sp.]